MKKLNDYQIKAIADADEVFKLVGLPTYTEVIEAMEKIASGLGTVGNPIDPISIAKEVLSIAA